MNNQKDQNTHSSSSGSSESILDTIMGARTASSLSNFQPLSLVKNILVSLRDRDREILVKRFGLNGENIETLEAIGKKYNLTRERVRQIEKDCLASLKKKGIVELKEALQLLFDTIVEHGSIMPEEFLIQTVLIKKNENLDQQAVKFLLSLGDQFHYHKETNDFWPSWSVVGYAASTLSEVIDQFISILKSEGRPMSPTNLFGKFKNSDYFKTNTLRLSDRPLKSYLSIAKAIQINPFSEIGLASWSEIKPRDVGDKAYLVLKHHGKPEHYSVITQLINEHKFDQRIAYKETVHNELIKDDRFILVGRGIYALSEWGYKKGVVADVITEILRSSPHPLSREEIITEVLKKRMVKRNTILVGLSNKKLFRKIGKDKYTLV